MVFKRVIKVDMSKSKLIIIKHSLISDTIIFLRDNWDSDLSQAGLNYHTKFKAHYGQYMSNDTEEKIMYSAKNMQNALNAFMKYKDQKLEEVIVFIELFIMEQFNNF